MMDHCDRTWGETELQVVHEVHDCFYRTRYTIVWISFRTVYIRVWRSHIYPYLAAAPAL